MNRHFISFSCIIATVVLQVATSILEAPNPNLDPDLIFYYNTRDKNGYSFAYKTKDGQYREEQGHIDPETSILRVTGLYRFQGTDGKTYEFNYEADENGYRIVSMMAASGGSPGSDTIYNTLLNSLAG
ncbi:larval cuticle protein 65Ag1-like [Anopheles moucheti]|uniref:larval cuticle protein 65Ag1-like n=1 Tax=Anopheles moucheti TaxID=186751 RepID=UPI0022F05355|nr:larval cuticle protein 65Ag1-like [Anopheles moucheti]